MLIILLLIIIILFKGVRYFLSMRFKFKFPWDGISCCLISEAETSLGACILEQSVAVFLRVSCESRLTN